MLHREKRLLAVSMTAAVVLKANAWMTCVSKTGGKCQRIRPDPRGYVRLRLLGISRRKQKTRRLASVLNSPLDSRESKGRLCQRKLTVSASIASYKGRDWVRTGFDSRSWLWIGVGRTFRRDEDARQGAGTNGIERAPRLGVAGPSIQQGGLRWTC